MSVNFVGYPITRAEAERILIQEYMNHKVTLECDFIKNILLREDLWLYPRSYNTQVYYILGKHVEINTEKLVTVEESMNKLTKFKEEVKKALRKIAIPDFLPLKVFFKGSETEIHDMEPFYIN